MYKKTTLQNGLRVVTVPMKDTKTVTVFVLVGTGSKNETKEINGLSHFVEHMMFKGTEKRPDTLAISEELDKIGAEFNAFTGNEMTAYYVKADYTNMDLALDVLSDMLLHSKLEDAEIQKEKGVVVEEINMYQDDPKRHIGDVLEQLMYGDQPAGWFIIGSKENVNSFERKHFVEYIKSQYLASNVVLCIAGNFDENEIEKKAEKYFGEMLGGEVKEKQAVIQKQDAPAKKIIFKDTDQTHFYVTLRSDINVSNDKRFSATLLANILGGNMSSRLFINIREKQGLAYYIRSGMDTTSDTGYFWVNAGVNNAKAKQAIDSILAELRGVAEKGVTVEELEKAKSYFKGKTFLGLESSDEIAGFFGTQEVIKGEILTPEETMERIHSVTIDEVNIFAKELFVSKNLNLALIGPFKDDTEFDDILNKGL